MPTADAPGGAVRRLLLLRHAKAERAGHGEDRLRPLALSGRRQAGQVGRAIASAGLAPDVVLCSTALRARQTWELVRAGLAPGVERRVELLDALYDAGPGDIVSLLQDLDAAERTALVVGHEPTLSCAAAALAGRDSDPQAVERVRAGMPTAGWTMLELAGSWSGLAPSAARLVRVVQTG